MSAQNTTTPAMSSSTDGDAMDMTEEITMFSCEFCPKKYKLKKQLNVHMNRCPNKRQPVQESQFYHCVHCKATYLIPATQNIEKIKDHACTPNEFVDIEINENPGAIEEVNLGCTFCFGTNKPVMKSLEDLKRHYLYGHCNNFFRCHIKESDPFKCNYCETQVKFTSSNWIEILHHVGLHHEKLFQAMKHSKKYDFTPVLRRLYPEKLQKWTDVERRRKERLRNSSNESGSTSTDSRRSSTDQELESLLSVSPLREQMQGREIDDTPPPSPAYKRRRKVSNTSTDSSTVSIPGKSPGKILKADGTLACDICPRGESNFTKETYLRDHLSFEHFFQYISKEHPNPEPSEEMSDGGKLFPCGFSYCEVTFYNTSARIKHIGNVHRLVDYCLSDPRQVKEAKKAAMKKKAAKAAASRRGRRAGTPPPRRRRSSASSERSIDGEFICRRCGVEQATKESLKLHDCGSNFSADEGVRPRSRSKSYNEESDSDEVPAAARGKGEKTVLTTKSPTRKRKENKNAHEDKRPVTPMANTVIVLSKIQDDDSSDGYEDDEQGTCSTGLITPTSLSCSPTVASNSDEPREKEDEEVDSDALLGPGELLEGLEDEVTHSDKEVSESSSGSSSDENEFSCDVCQRAFRTYFKLKAHRQCSTCKQKCVSGVHKTCEYCKVCFEKADGVFHEKCEAFNCTAPCFTDSEKFKEHVGQHDFSEF